jgi:hypothetical protein
MMLAVLLTAGAEEAPAGHAGFLARCYRDGSFSDAWTDVSRCAGGTFVGYVPVCSCGWRGPVQPATSRGRLLSSRLWRDDHLSHLQAACAAPLGSIATWNR